MSTMRTANRFEKGSGCFKCTACSRQTRSTGGDNDAVKLCEECYEMAGIENALSDGNLDAAREIALNTEWHELKSRCIAKGGQP